MRKKFALIAFVLAVWAVATWNGGWFARWNLPFWNAASEFPLGDAKGIVVDSQGEFTVAPSITTEFKFMIRAADI
jgi:hypothetical protein